MDRHEAAEVLRRILRSEMAECDRSVRDRDPVGALNHLADAARGLKSLADELESDRDGRASDATATVGVASMLPVDPGRA